MDHKDILQMRFTKVNCSKYEGQCRNLLLKLLIQPDVHDELSRIARGR
jgi:hypothetical protein